ncbi:MAG: hypothetical protein FJ297_15275 [Planctomycetes bacterium]|nr:hypothetical protein [Planctomycetota bacterium]
MADLGATNADSNEQTRPVWLREAGDVLRRFASAAGVVRDTVAIQAALTAADDPANPLEPRLVLEDAAGRLGLSVIHRELAPRGLRQGLERNLVRATAVVWNGATWWAIILRVRGGKIELDAGAGRSVWMRIRDFLARCGDHADQPRLWLAGRAAMPFEDASVAGPAMPSSDLDHVGHAAPHLSPIRRLGLILQCELADIGAIAVFAGAVGLLALATPIAVESLVNTIAFGRLIQPLLVLCLILFTLLGFAGVLKLIQAFLAEIMQRRIFVRVVRDLSYRLRADRARAGESAPGACA